MLTLSAFDQILCHATNIFCQKKELTPFVVHKDLYNPKKTGPRSNREINVPDVQLIDAEGENRGVVNTSEAMAMAQEAGLDLVEISPNAKPPVCKILDLGKYKYQAQKKLLKRAKSKKSSTLKKSRCDRTRIRTTLRSRCAML